jgi:cytoskeleton protein RodZ
VPNPEALPAAGGVSPIAVVEGGGEPPAVSGPEPVGPAAVPPAGPRRTLLRPPPWDKAAEAETSASFGTWLRRQREARQIGLREIAERTKISLRYLEAMEEDHFEVLPAPIFAKGFLREYARYVGLSPDEVVNHWLSVTKGPAPEEGEAPFGSRRAPSAGPAATPVMAVGGGRQGMPRWLGLALGVVVLLGLVGIVAFLSERWRQVRAGRGEDRPPIVAPVAAPVPPPPPAAAPPPSVPLEVVVDFNQECWVEAVVDGGSRRAEMREQGESMQLEAKQSVVFTKLGNGAAVDIQVNGYPYPLEKKQGEVLHDLKIDLDTVRALKAKRELKEGH